MDMYANPDGRGGKKKYIRLRVYKDRIEQTISKEKIKFENDLGNPMGSEAVPLKYLQTA